MIKAPQDDGSGVRNNISSSTTTPIYYKEQTVGNDDKLYDVMILIKPKNATITVADNASQESTPSNINQSDNTQQQLDVNRTQALNNASKQ